MKLNDYLISKSETLVKAWYKAVLNTYPPDSVKVLSQRKDPFQNPVGHNLAEGVEALFHELLGNIDTAAVKKPLDAIIRIRSVQDFSPAEAVGCIFLIKEIIRKEAAKEIKQFSLHDELLKFEDKVDRLALMAFDNYTECRENLYEIRIREAKAGSIKLIDRLNRGKIEQNSDNS